MYILGINMYHPDSSAALVVDGKLIAACEEERFRRIKYFAGFPAESIRYCLKESAISIKDIDYIALPRKPRTRFFKKIFYAAKIPALAKRRLFAWEKTFQIKQKLSEIFRVDAKEIKAKVINIEHHRAHLASSFFVSGFDSACLFSTDALGDFASTMWGVGENNKIRVLGEITFPHSLGFYYTAITQYLGFLEFGDEYKVMGLAAYGEPTYEDEFERILRIKNNRFELDLEYFLHHKQLIDMRFEDEYPKLDLIFSSYLEKRLGKARKPYEPLDKRHKDIACSLQKRLEKVIMHLLNSIFPKNLPNLCLSGGVAFNCVANGKILKKSAFKKIYIPPAAGDAGLAIGAAFYLWNQVLNNSRAFFMEHAYWGPSFSNGDIEQILSKYNLKFKRYDENELVENVAERLASGKIVGWFQGRMEWGPRALGNRSILADPRSKDMKDILNARIKHRESFRPFAPSILEEYVGEYFLSSHFSPFMLLAFQLKKEKAELIPAVIHVDGTARVQTVNKESSPLFWKLINEFRNITGVPLLLNTSFNENEPIVSCPEEALKCFLRTQIDILVMGNYLIQK